MKLAVRPTSAAPRLHTCTQAGTQTRESAAAAQPDPGTARGQEGLNQMIRAFTRLSLLSVAALASAGAASADIFLKTTTAAGDATQRGFEGQIAISGVNMGISSFTMPDPEGVVTKCARPASARSHHEEPGPFFVQADGRRRGRRAARPDRDHLHLARFAPARRRQLNRAGSSKAPKCAASTCRRTR
jgi:hypothetical protein